MSKKERFDELANRVNEGGNLLVVSMAELRDCYEVSRLGRHVIHGIENEMARRGIGHFPTELPKSQHEEVRLYVRGTGVGDLIEAVLRPSPNGDDLLRRTGEAGAQEILQTIRELICN